MEWIQGEIREEEEEEEEEEDLMGDNELIPFVHNVNIGCMMHLHIK